MQVDAEAKEASEPPKLGRHRFTPLPVQVLASDDVTGSLRKLKTIPVVVKDRFKSLQKRGMIQVCTASPLNTHYCIALCSAIVSTCIVRLMAGHSLCHCCVCAVLSPI